MDGVRSFPTQVVALVALATGAVVASGCGGAPASLDSPDSPSQLKAIRRAAAAGDSGAVKGLIDLLESDDPAVRLAAIRALEYLTGETHGYDHAGDDQSRREAVVRWVDWAATRDGVDTAPHGGAP